MWPKSIFLRGSVIILFLAAASAPAVLSQQTKASRPSSQADARALFLDNCSKCHGMLGQGLSGIISIAGPSLEAEHDPQTVATRIRDGKGTMPTFKPLLSPQQIDELTDYVTQRLAVIPLQPGDLSEGGRLFRVNCAPCHGTAARGGALAFAGINAPSLLGKTAATIAGAIRWGPGPMPSFPERVISDQQLDSITTYVRFMQRPPSPGGIPMKYYGSVAEGLIAWIAMCLMVGLTVWIEKEREGMSGKEKQPDRGDWILVLAGAIFGWVARKVFSHNVATFSGAGRGRSVPVPEETAAREVDSRAQQPRPFPEGGVSREIHDGAGVLLILCVFLLSMAAAIGFVVAYWIAASRAFLGGMIALSIAAFGAGLVMWAHALMNDQQVIEEREILPSLPREREEAAKALFAEHEVRRRKMLLAMSFGIVGAFAAAVLSLFRSFEESPESVLNASIWRRGDHLVTTEGRLVTTETLRPGSTVSIFPENRVGQVNAQAVLVRVDEQLLRLPKARAAWAPQGYLAYSRVCTHAGCSVGLYEAETCLLECPCHQSTFDVLSAAQPTGGPAARPLPQLPLYADEDGNLRAGGDFSETPGPGFWRLR